MKVFNAIQIVTALTTSPIWLSALKTATFTGSSILFGLGVVVSLVFFGWSIAGVVATMEK